jgi:hypothetical protein
MKPIIGGPDTPKPQAARAECGGVRMEDVKSLPYSPPKGPTEQMRNAVGLGGSVHPKGTQRG